jgi:hypothetical protein
MRTVTLNRWILGRTILMFGSASTFCAASGLAHAGEPNCKAVTDAMLRAVTTPHHSFTKAGSLSMEEIYDGKNIYSLIAGKWSVSRLTPQILIDQEKENEREGKVACSVVRDESIDGVSATLYSVRAERGGDTSIEQIWISKATGLPVHLKTDVPTDTRYIFSGIAAPDIR